MSLRRETQLSTAILVFVVLLLSLQLFLLAVAAEGFLAGEAGLGWAATIISVFLAVISVMLYRFLPRRD